MSLRKHYSAVIVGVALVLSGAAGSRACETCQKFKAALASQPVRLVEGLGKHSHPVSTDVPEAQCYFDQGLAYLYAFNHAEAIRSFEHAAELDSTLAMAHWGIAFAYGPNYNWPGDSAQLHHAYDAVQKARSLKSHASEHEREYIYALSKRYSANPLADRPPLDTAYRDAMRELANIYPDDPDAQVLFADAAMNLRPWKLYFRDGRPAPGTQEFVAALERTLKRYPDHPGVNHYYIHAVEASTNPGLALRCAERLGELTPSAGHLVHMPAHVYMRVGEYEAASQANYNGMVRDEEYLKNVPHGGFYELMYYNHNIHFLAVSRAMEGRYAEALMAAAKVDSHAVAAVAAMPFLEGFAITEPLVMVRSYRWYDVLELPKPDTSLRLITALWRYSRALALIGVGRIDEGKAEQAEYFAATKIVSPDAYVGAFNSAGDVFKITDNVLAGQLAWADGDRDGSIAHLERAVEAQDSLNYDEPEGWYIPARETLGAKLFLKKDLAAAEQVFRTELDKHPRNGRALFGLRETLKAMNRTTAASFVDREFQTAWEKADTQLSIEEL